MLFGAWDVPHFQQWCHLGKAAECFQRLIDSYITCNIPNQLKQPVIHALMKQHLFTEGFDESKSERIAKIIVKYQATFIKCRKCEF